LRKKNKKDKSTYSTTEKNNKNIALQESLMIGFAFINEWHNCNFVVIAGQTKKKEL